MFINVSINKQVVVIQGVSFRLKKVNKNPFLNVYFENLRSAMKTRIYCLRMLGGEADVEEEVTWVCDVWLDGGLSHYHLNLPQRCVK